MHLEGFERISLGRKAREPTPCTDLVYCAFTNLTPTPPLVVGCGRQKSQLWDERMPFFSPSELCWNVRFPPGQEWIETTVQAAIETIWRRTHSTARSHFGDESLAVEMMEVAIEKTGNSLSNGAPADSSEASLLLLRSMPRRPDAGGMPIADLSLLDRAQSYHPREDRIRSYLLIRHLI